MPALKPLPEHALGAVAVLFEFDPGFFLQLPFPLVTQREGHDQHAHELADPAALGHVGVLEWVAALHLMAAKGFDTPSHPLDPECLRALKTMADDRQSMSGGLWADRDVAKNVRGESACWLRWLGDVSQVFHNQRLTP